MCYDNDIQRTFFRKEVFRLAILKEKNYTLDDIYKLPEGQRAELIDGYIYDMAPPSRRHQRISFEISRMKMIRHM